ncbi:unnamed protein product, partial [Bodo saltans]
NVFCPRSSSVLEEQGSTNTEPQLTSRHISTILECLMNTFTRLSTKVSNTAPRPCTNMMYTVAQEAKIIINEPIEHTLRQTTKHDFLGVEYNMFPVAQTRLTERFLDRLRQARESLRGTPTMRDFLKITGRILYANVVMESLIFYSLDFYYMYKFLCRRVGTGLDTAARIWPSLVFRLQGILALLLKNEPRQWQIAAQAPSSLSHAALFTDASLEGYGAVLIMPDASLNVVAGKWTLGEKKIHIGILEAQAVPIALRNLTQLSLHKFDLWIDNTSVLGNLVLRNRYKAPPRSFEFASRVREIKTTEAWGNCGSVRYVPSDVNPADAPSRGFHVTWVPPESFASLFSNTSKIQRIR